MNQTLVREEAAPGLRIIGCFQKVIIAEGKSLRMLEHTKILNCGISQQQRDAMIPLLSRDHFWEYHACPSLVFSRVNGCGPADGPELWLLGVPAAGEASGRLLPVPGVPA